MDFWFGILIGSILWIVLGMVLYLSLGRSDGAENRSAIGKIFLSVPFLSLLIFALVCLTVAIVVELVFLQSEFDSFQSFLSSPKTWVAFSKELFFAAFIAMVIIIVVEAASNEEQSELMEKFKSEQEELVQSSIKKAQQSVFEGVYENALDPQIFTEVVDTIFKASFVRDEHHRSMVLEAIPSNSKQLLMKVRQTYVVTNVSDGPRNNNQTFYLPNTYNSNGPLNRFTKLSIATLIGDNEVPSEYPFEYEDGKDLPDGITVEPSKSGAETVWTFPAIKLVEGGKIRVELELQLVKDISDNEILTFLSPTLKGSFSVHSYVDGLEVKAISLHRGALSETPDGGDDFKRWTFDRPMLPYQGYVVMWSKVC